MKHPDTRCPLAAVDQRLEDVHRLWHQAAESYFDPDGFRLAIQGTIQTLRTVTFILQKNKSVIPEFDRWYGEWQERLAGDRLLSWMKDARNTIEKKGDLDTHSFIRAEIIASYTDIGPRIEVPAKLWDAPLQLVKSIPKGAIGTHIKQDGIVRIQRRWVENSLPEYELLDAVAIAYGQLSMLVADAHRQVGLDPPRATHVRDAAEYPDGDRQGRLPCMIGHADRRSLDVWLATGVPISFEEVPVNTEGLEAAALEARYGVKAQEIYGESSILDRRLHSLFSTARKLFETDGFHKTIVFLLRNGIPINIRELRPAEHGHKYLMMRHVAHEVVKRGADAVILMGEAWLAPFDPTNPLARAADSPNKIELLTAVLVRREGDPVELSAEIMRGGAALSLGPTQERLDGAQAAFAPIYQAWGRPIPDSWAKAAARDSAR